MFKKAEFNSLMASIAVGGWVLNFFYPRNISIIGVAVVATAYCGIRSIVYLFNLCRRKAESHQEKRITEREHKEQLDLRNIEIARMFKGLTPENKNILSILVSQGEADEYYKNVLHYSNDDLESRGMALSAISVSKIYRNQYKSYYNQDGGEPCVGINEYTDSFTVTIDACLYDLIMKQNHDKPKKVDGKDL